MFWCESSVSIACSIRFIQLFSKHPTLYICWYMYRKVRAFQNCCEIQTKHVFFMTKLLSLFLGKNHNVGVKIDVILRCFTELTEILVVLIFFKFSTYMDK